MKTKEEIQKAVFEICKDSDYEGSHKARDLEITVEDRYGGGFNLKIAQMYNCPIHDRYSGNVLKFFDAVQAACDAKNIELGHDIAQSGCETCDHGSEYGWCLQVWD